MAKTLVLQLDFHKSLQIPKISSQDAYFCKRLTTRLFGIFDAGSKKLHAFIYPCTVAGEGPDEVISMLDFLLTRLQTGFNHLILWADNCPGQFKETYLFFYCDYLIHTNRFLRVDLKFLLEGHTYSICDRRFGNIEVATRRFEVIESPADWISKLRENGLTNLEIYEVTVDMIKSYKMFLRNAYVNRGTDVDGNTAKVRKLAWLNFGAGELTDDNGVLVTTKIKSGECFVRFSIDPYEKPRRISFLKKKQWHPLHASDLKVKLNSINPVSTDVKENCVKLASKYLSCEASQYYESLATIDE